MAKKIKIGAGIALDGEKEFKKAISDINSSARVLGSEMKKTSEQFKGTANTTAALTEKNKILNGQVDNQRQKVEVLRQALEKTQKEYGENDTRTDKWKSSLNIAEAELSKLDHELEKNEKALDEAKKSSDGHAKSIDEFGKETKQSTEQTLKFSDILKANLASEAIIGGVKMLTNAAKDLGKEFINLATDAAGYADDILTLSQQTGISTKKLQQFKYMTGLVDVELETVTGSMKKNIKAMDNTRNGSKSFVEAYKTLGVEVMDKNKKLRDSEAVYWDCIDALGKMKNETERDALAMKIFGKSAQDLNPMILKGADGMKELKKEASEMGAVLSEDTLDSLGETQDSLDRLDQQMEIVKRQIGVAVAPMVQELSDELITFAKENKEQITDFVENGLDSLKEGLGWCVENADELKVAAVGFVSVFTTLKTISFASNVVSNFSTIKNAITPVKTAIDGVSTAQTGVSASAGLIGIAFVAATTVATVGLLKYQDSLTRLSEKEEALRKEIDKNYDAYTNIKEARDIASGDIQFEYSRLEDLRSELSKITNKNGDVKKGYEERAKIITNELSKALGIEIKMTGNQIENYSDLNKKVKNTIKLKQTEAMLEANQPAYNDAIKNRAQAYVEYQETLKNVQKTQTEFDKARLLGDFNKQTKLQAQLDVQAQMFSKAEKKYVGYASTIENYDNLLRASVSGNQEKIKKALENMQQNFISAEQGTGGTLKNQADMFGKYYINLKKQIEAGAPNVSNKMVEQAEKMSKKANDTFMLWKTTYGKTWEENGKAGAKALGSKETQEEFKKATQQDVNAVANVLNGKFSIAGEKAAGDLAGGFAIGLKNKESYSSKKMREFAESMLKGFKDKMEIKSPSKVMMRMGQYVDQGLALGISGEYSNKAAGQLGKNVLASTNKVLKEMSYSDPNTSNLNAIAIKKQQVTSESGNELSQLSQIGNGDLTINLQINQREIFKAVYTEFRMQKRSDPTITMS